MTHVIGGERYVGPLVIRNNIGTSTWSFWACLVDGNGSVSHLDRNNRRQTHMRQNVSSDSDFLACEQNGVGLVSLVSVSLLSHVLAIDLFCTYS